MRFVFLPVGLAAGLLAGVAGKKLFEAAWGLIDDEEPPAPEHRDVSLLQLAAALAIEGAVFRVAKGMVDHGARRGFAGVTGVWPGEEKPDPE
jgi:Protein of unknown function (DUF4235)